MILNRLEKAREFRKRIRILGDNVGGGSKCIKKLSIITIINSGACRGCGTLSVKQMA